MTISVRELSFRDETGSETSMLPRCLEPCLRGDVNETAEIMPVNELVESMMNEPLELNIEKASQVTFESEQRESVQKLFKASNKGPGPPRRKTEPCRNVLETGRCQFFESCDFIHPGETERIIRPKDYKAGLCTYSTGGVEKCPYGQEGCRMSRCTWAHAGEPIRFPADRPYLDHEYYPAVQKHFPEADSLHDRSNGMFSVDAFRSLLIKLINNVNRFN